LRSCNTRRALGTRFRGSRLKKNALLCKLEVTTWTFVLFAWLISRTFSANEQYFSLIINQPTVLSVIPYQPSEQGIYPLQYSFHPKKTYYARFGVSQTFLMLMRFIQNSINICITKNVCYIRINYIIYISKDIINNISIVFLVYI